MAAEIEAMRRTRQWSASRIRFELRTDGIVIARRTVTKILRNLGRNRRRFIDPNGETNRKPHVIVAKRPSQMVHVDIKKVGKIHACSKVKASPTRNSSPNVSNNGKTTSAVTASECHRRAERQYQKLRLDHRHEKLPRYCLHLHIVVKLTASLGIIRKEAVTRTVAQVLNEFADTVPGLLFYRAGNDLALQPNATDFGIVALFDSSSSYTAYAVDEQHQAIISELIAPDARTRTSTQITLG